MSSKEAQMFYKAEKYLYDTLELHLGSIVSSEKNMSH